MTQRIPTLRAYCITFTTYGARLRGDPRGSNDRHANVFGEPSIAPNKSLLGAQRELMSQPRFVMGDSERRVVTQAIRSICFKRDWPLHALNVRTNHVHIVVAAVDRTPEMMMASFKAVATLALRRSRSIDGERRVWSRHGSTRHLFEAEAVPSAVRYVVDRQGGNLDGAWYLEPGFEFGDM